MDYNININKICRVCLEEGVLTSIFNTEFAMMPAEMIILCAKIKVYKNDGLPPVICNNCIYRLGAAYHFKQQCENSDLRLRSYLGILEKGYGTRDNETNTEHHYHQPAAATHTHQISALVTDGPSDDDDDDEPPTKADPLAASKRKSRSRYKRKLPEDRKKRGPKPQPKVTPTCYECHKTFKCPAQLRTHIRTHTGDRPFICSYCPRRFAQKHNLAIHVRTHTGERPFQCEICSKQFAALGNFQAHKKIHTGIRDQVCPLCQKSFVTAGDLARHMATHTGIKNHHCDVCGKAFSRNRDMVAHRKKIHHHLMLGGNGGGAEDRAQQQQQQQQTDLMHVSVETAEPSDTYKCRECHKVFATELNLATHMRTTVHDSQSDMVMASGATGGPTSGMMMPIAPTAISVTSAAAVAGGLSLSCSSVPHSLAHHHAHTHIGSGALPLLPPSAATTTLGLIGQTSTTALDMMHTHPHAHHHHHHHPHAAVHHHHHAAVHHPQRLHPF